MKQFLIISSIILLLSSCGGRKSNLEPAKEKPKPVYYLENDLNTHFNLHGPVHTLSKIFMRSDTDKLFQSVLGLKMYPLLEIANYRGLYEFDTLGIKIQMFKYRDSLDFENNTKNAIGSIYFYKTDSFPANIAYKTTYSPNIIYPGMLEPTQAFETVSANIPNEEANIDRDSLYYNTYSYILDDGKIKYRLEQNILPNGTALPYYEERVEYVYDSLNRIVKENYSYYEILDNWFPPTRVSHEYHNIKVGSREKMHKTFTYDENGRIAKVVMYINDHYVFEEQYKYDKKGRLVSKIQIDPRWRAHLGNRSYRSIYHYDQYGNITRVDMHNKESELQEQLWVDYYNFDEHNNWQRCEMFLNNTHEGEPQLVGYRRITYYMSRNKSG